MKTYWYQIITEDCMQIDFNKVYEIVKSNLEPEATCDAIYYEFADNLQYYLQHELNYDDFDEEDNDYISQLIVNDFYKYLKENFNYD